MPELLPPAVIRPSRHCGFALRPLFLALLLLFTAGYTLLKIQSPLIVAASGNDGQGRIFLRQPYEIGTAKDRVSTLTITLQYAFGQNPRFAVESLGGCINRVLAGPLPEAVPPPAPPVYDTAPFCHEAVLDLSSRLKEGLNRIVLEITPDSTGTYWDMPFTARIHVASELFGADRLSTIGCLCIFGAAVWLLYGIARRQGLDAAASVMACLGLAYYMLWLHVRPNTLYTADVPDHIRYVFYMVQHWIQPYAYQGGENHQPPLYYFLTGVFINLLSAPDAISALSVARIFSLLLYMVFCLYGLRALSEAARNGGAAYYVGVALIVFWPVAVETATTINNDLAVYAAWGAAFYYMSGWYREGDMHSLRCAIASTGVALMVKSTSLVLVALLACCMLYALIAGHLAWRQLFRGNMLMAFGVLASGAIISVGKLIYSKIFLGQAIGLGNVSYLYFAGVNSHSLYPFRHFVQVDLHDFLVNPYSIFLREPGFLNYFLKTMLYSQWNHPGNSGGLPSAINLLLALLLVITCLCSVPLFFCSRRGLGDLMPAVLGILIPMAGVIVFTVVHNDEFCQSFRYVYPMLVPLVIVFVRGLEAARAEKSARALYWVGMAVGVSFPASAIVLYMGFHPVG